MNTFAAQLDRITRTSFWFHGHPITAPTFEDKLRAFRKHKFAEAGRTVADVPMRSSGGRQATIHQASRPAARLSNSSHAPIMECRPTAASEGKDTRSSAILRRGTGATDRRAFHQQQMFSVWEA